MMKLKDVFAPLAVVSLGSCNSAPKEPSHPLYDTRSGEAEASERLRAGYTAKLYAHLDAGVIVAYSSPGIRHCAPLRTNARIFLPLPDADFQEGERRTPEQDALAASAYRFAQAYNQTMYHHREKELRHSCPRIELAESPHR